MTTRDEVDAMLRAWEEQNLVLRELVMAPVTMAAFLREMAPYMRFESSDPLPIGQAMYMGILIRESRMVPEGRAWPVLEREGPSILPLPVKLPLEDDEAVSWDWRKL